MMCPSGYGRSPSSSDIKVLSHTSAEPSPVPRPRKSMHGRVVDQARRYAERFGEIETNPSLTQMLWIAYDASLAHGRWETDGRHVKFPPTRGLFKFRDQLFRCHARP